jgi:hypothetical protein
MTVSRPRISKRAFLAGLALGGISLAGYMRYLEPRWLRRREHTVPLRLRNGQPPLRILHLSDFHASSVVSLNYITRAIEVGLAWKPDLICVTGDFITEKYDQLDRFGEILALLSRTAPTFASLGNHDGGRWARWAGGYADTAAVRALLARSRIELLHNTSRQAEVRGWQLNLVGLGDLWADEVDAAAAFAGLSSPLDRATLVLSHNPDSKELAERHPWHLMLCGHTHGGQLYLPGLGTPFAPVRDKRFVQGLHRWQNRWIHISEGVGNVYGLRFNCPPTVSLLTLI